MNEKSRPDRKLNFELVPDGCWGYNLRSVLTSAQWNYIRQTAKERASGKCMICGAKTDRPHTHEKWSYDEKKHVAKLEDVLSVCAKCHSAIHIGRTQLLGNSYAAEKHYMKVNGISYAEYRADLGFANDENRRLSRISEWALDLSFLKKYLGL